MTSDTENTRIRIEKSALDAIRENIALQSVLYDADMLPEQLERGTKQWVTMLLLCYAFMAGQENPKKTT